MKISSRTAQVLLATAGAVALTASLATSAHADAPYRPITNKHSGKCLDVTAEDGYYSNGARIQQYHCTGAQEQQWTVNVRAAGSDPSLYELQSLRSGKCLEVRGNSLANEAQIDQTTCGSNLNVGTAPWLWVLTPLGGDYYTLTNYDSGKCLDVRGASTADRAMIQQYTCNGTDAQKFHISLT